MSIKLKDILIGTTIGAVFGFLIILTPTYNDYKHLYSQKNLSDAAIVTTINEGKYEIYHRGIILENTDDLVSEAYSHIPEELLNSFYDEGCHFVTAGIEEFGLDELYSGVTLYNHSDCIGITVRCDPQAISIPNTICHEYGHYLDYLTDASSTDEWIQICKEEYPESRLTGYYATPEEYFAEIFAYHCYPNIPFTEIQRRNCPKSYEYMDRVVSELITQAQYL